MSITSSPRVAAELASEGEGEGQTGSLNQDGREGNGRFARGNKGGPGNPFGRLTAALKKAFIKNITPEDMGEIVKALIEEAKNGNVAAAKIVINYTIGKPTAMENLMYLCEEEEAEKEEVTPVRADGWDRIVRDSEREVTFESLRNANLNANEPMSDLGRGNGPEKGRQAPSPNGGNGGEPGGGKGGGGRR